MEEEQDIYSDIVERDQLLDAQKNKEFDRNMDAYRRGKNLTDEQRKKVLLDNAEKRQQVEQEKQQLKTNIKAELDINLVAGVGFETAVNVATDALTSALGWAPPLYAVANFLSAGGANLVAQKVLRGKEDIDWGEAWASASLGVIPFMSPAAGRLTRVVGKPQTIKRAVVGGGLAGVGYQQIEAGINERRVISPTEAALGFATGGTVTAGLTKGTEVLGKQILRSINAPLVAAQTIRPGMSKLDLWKSITLKKLQGKKTHSGTEYKTIDDIPDLRIPRSAVFKKFKGEPNLSEVEDALYKYEYGALVHRELEGQGTLSGFRPFEGYASRGYLDPKDESWIFRSKGTTRGVKNYQWNKAKTVSEAATKRLKAEKEILNKLDTQLGYVAEITGVPKEEFANISKQSAIEKASREQLQQQIKTQRQELGLEGEALLHDEHLKDLHLEHVIGVLQYPEFLDSTYAANWILNRKNNHGLAGYHEEPPPIWSVILAGKHNKWFVDIVQDAFATPTSKRSKSGYKTPKLSGKDLGLGTDESKRLFTYPEVLPQFTEPGSIPGDMIISTWDGTQTWRVPRALAILDFIKDKDVTRAIIQGTSENNYKDGLLARIISGEKIDISETVLVGELMTRAKELGVNKNILREYWNEAKLESKQEILWLLKKMGATQEFIEQIGSEMVPMEKGDPYIIKGGYLK